MALIIGGNIPISEKTNDCVLETKIICAPTPDLLKLKNLLKLMNINVNSDYEIIEKFKQLLKVDSEVEIWEHKLIRKYLGDEVVDKIIKNLFKTEGPSDSTALLDNDNIDKTLASWSRFSQTLFHKKFYHVPFQMIDFAEKDKELANLDIMQLIQGNYDCFGVVLNTDVSSGYGLHWFCIYGDLAHKGTSEDPYRIEYFNSSGNPPMSEVEIWLEKTCYNLMRDHAKHCIVIRSAPKRLQYSSTECGVWSIMYIKSRLQNHPPDWFFKVGADDKDMIKLRKHLFRKKH